MHTPLPPSLCYVKYLMRHRQDRPWSREDKMVKQNQPMPHTQNSDPSRAYLTLVEYCSEFIALPGRFMGAFFALLTHVVENSSVHCS